MNLLSVVTSQLSDVSFGYPHILARAGAIDDILLLTIINTCMNKLIKEKARGLMGMIIIAMALSVAYVSSPYFLKTPKAESSATDNVYGWAWSYGGVLGDSYAGGWISANNIDCDNDQNGNIDTGACGGNNTSTPALGYGVNVDITGIISGVAWSPNMGWISFNRASTNNPPFPPYNTGSGPIATVDSSGNVTGWARVLAGCRNNLLDAFGNCTGSAAGNNAGGWDGWIKLAKEPTDTGVDYGVKLIGNNFSGDAWGSDSGGWIRFATKEPTDVVNYGWHISGSCTISSPDFVLNPTCFPSVVCTAANAGESLGTGYKTGNCTSTGGSIQIPGCTPTPDTCPAVTAPGTCGDGICDATLVPKETPSSCPKDCRAVYKQF